MNIYKEFENLFSIMSHDSFLKMEGLGNEVSFFIHAYDINHQNDVYTEIHQLTKRLRVEKGIETLVIGLYDKVIESFIEEDELEDTFKFENEHSKGELIKQFTSMMNPEYVNIPYLQKGCQKVIVIFC